jgi:hypothetical protein
LYLREKTYQVRYLDSNYQGLTNNSFLKIFKFDYSISNYQDYAVSLLILLKLKLIFNKIKDVIVKRTKMFKYKKFNNKLA